VQGVTRPVPRYSVSSHIQSSQIETGCVHSCSSGGSAGPASRRTNTLPSTITPPAMRTPYCRRIARRLGLSAPYPKKELLQENDCNRSLLNKLSLKNAQKSRELGLRAYRNGWCRHITTMASLPNQAGIQRPPHVFTDRIQKHQPS